MFLKIVVILGLGSSLFAGDNSQATMGDMKEAIYKLILQNKQNSIVYKSKQTKYDGFIKQYVKENKELIKTVEK